MPRPDPLSQIRWLYHFTDSLNVSLICELGGLYSRAKLKEIGVEFHSGGNEGSLDADEMFGMDEYVHLAFERITQWNFIAKQQGRIERTTWLYVEPSVLRLDGLMYSHGFSNKSGMVIRPIQEAIDLIDFEVICTRTDWRDPAVKALLDHAEKCEVLVPEREAKKDPRLRESGPLIGFVFDEYQWPLEPKTAFYDWLYAGCIYPHCEWATKLHGYGGFSDIEFNPYRSINCQARSIALFLSLLKRGQLDEAMQSPSQFIRVLLSSEYRPRLRSDDFAPRGLVRQSKIAPSFTPGFERRQRLHQPKCARLAPTSRLVVGVSDLSSEIRPAPLTNSRFPSRDGGERPPARNRETRTVEIAASCQVADAKRR